MNVLVDKIKPVELLDKTSRVARENKTSKNVELKN